MGGDPGLEARAALAALARGLPAPGRCRAHPHAAARRKRRCHATRELHQPRAPPRRLMAHSAVGCALGRQPMVCHRKGRHGPRVRPRVARAQGAARPPHEAAQPFAAHGPYAPGAHAPASQRRSRRAPVHGFRPLQVRQRPLRPRRRRPAPAARLGQARRNDARQRHGGAPGRRRVRDPGRGPRKRSRSPGSRRAGA